MLDLIFSKLKLSRLKWYDLKSVEPISRKFGFDRGTPIDRYYIERFLHDQKHYIHGKVLEVAESHYSKKFGSDVEAYEILHIEKKRNATIIGDLTRPESLPDNLVDCFICTQVFNFIYDFQKAIEGTYRILKPGGVVLATVSGISQISRFDADRWGHFWSFYPQGIERAFKASFGEESVVVKSYGNSLSSIAFLKGIASEELMPSELEFNDPDYPVSITIVATKNKV